MYHSVPAAWIVPESPLPHVLAMSELSLGPQAKRANRLNLSPTQKELLAGTVGGVAQVLVGQPFDLV